MVRGRHRPPVPFYPSGGLRRYKRRDVFEYLLRIRTTRKPSEAILVAVKRRDTPAGGQSSKEENPPGVTYPRDRLRKPSEAILEALAVLPCGLLGVGAGPGWGRGRGRGITPADELPILWNRWVSHRLIGLCEFRRSLIRRSSANRVSRKFVGMIVRDSRAGGA